MAKELSWLIERCSSTLGCTETVALHSVLKMPLTTRQSQLSQNSVLMMLSKWKRIERYLELWSKWHAVTRLLNRANTHSLSTVCMGPKWNLSQSQQTIRQETELIHHQIGAAVSLGIWTHILKCSGSCSHGPLCPTFAWEANTAKVDQGVPVTEHNCY